MFHSYLFNSNKFDEFWMSSDFRRIHDKKGRIWAKTQADRPILGRLAWHLYNPAMSAIQGHCLELKCI